MCEQFAAVCLEDSILSCIAQRGFSNRLGSCVQRKSLKTLDTMSWQHCSLGTGVHLQSA